MLDGAQSVLRVAEDAVAKAQALFAWMVDPRVIAAILVIVGVFCVLRLRAQKGAFEKRVRWAMLPADEFDPRPEDIKRFAFALARARRAGARSMLAGRSAAAIRVRFEHLPEGRMLTTIEGPEASRSIVRAAMYGLVELREDPDPASNGQLGVDEDDEQGQALDDEQTEITREELTAGVR